MTPYALTCGHDAILPMEIVVQSLRIAQQNNLVGEDYSQAMLLELEGLDTSRIDTLNKLLAGKQAVARAYRDGDIHAAPINDKWMKKFYPTMWDSQAVQTDPGIEKEKDRTVV
ncbi:unnamed protein product [Prunus brigantina]